MGKKKDEPLSLEQKYQILPLDSIEANEGQIEGLPANPRKIDEEKFELLKNNIRQYPELLEYRGLLVYPLGDKYITIGGNMRLRALVELGYNEAPCAVLPASTTVEQLKAYVILDNDNFGQWNWEMIANEWDLEALNEFGIDVPYLSNEELNLDDLYSELGETKKDDIKKIEIEVPKELEDKIEDIKNAVKLTLEEWEGCKVK